MRIKLGIPLELGEVVEATRGRLNEKCHKSKIKFLSTDTRELEPGDLFVALRGERYDGNDFIKYAKERGAITLGDDISADILTKFGNASLLFLASYFKNKLKRLKYTIAITGSVGKTTTKEFTKILLSTQYSVHSTPENYNNLIGMPLTLLSAPADTEILILEMGMNRLGEISQMSKCAKPDIALITNIGTAHIGNLGSKENISKAKKEIFDGMTDGEKIIPYGEELLSDIENATYFSTVYEDADVFINKENENLNVHIGSKLFASSDFRPIGNHNLECLCAAIAISSKTKANLNESIRCFSLVSHLNTRQSYCKMGELIIIDDTYNASFESISSGFATLDQMNNCSFKSAVIGSVLELGEYSERIHYEIGKAAAGTNLTRLYLFGELASVIAKGAKDGGFPSNCIFINSDESEPSETAKQIKSNSVPGEVILFKASHKVKLSRIIDELKNLFEEDTNE